LGYQGTKPPDWSIIKMKLSIVVPARDEEENIEKTVKNLIPFIEPADTEIVVVNDHSKDHTETKVRGMQNKYPFIRLVNNTELPNFANALKTGFESASGEFVIPFMAELKRVSEGYDLVCGSRYIRGGRKVGGPVIQGFFSRFVGVTLHLFTGISTRDVSNALRWIAERFFFLFHWKRKVLQYQWRHALISFSAVIKYVMSQQYGTEERRESQSSVCQRHFPTSGCTSIQYGKNGCLNSNTGI